MFFSESLFCSVGNSTNFGSSGATLWVMDHGPAEVEASKKRNRRIWMLCFWLSNYIVRPFEELRIFNQRQVTQKWERRKRHCRAYLYHNHNCPLRGGRTEEAIYLNLNGGEGAGWVGADRGDIIIMVFMVSRLPHRRTSKPIGNFRVHGETSEINVLHLVSHCQRQIHQKELVRTNTLCIVHWIWSLALSSIVLEFAFERLSKSARCSRSRQREWRHAQG